MAAGIDNVSGRRLRFAFLAGVGFVLTTFFTGTLSGRTLIHAAPQAEPPSVRLVSPGRDTALTEGPVRFAWRLVGDSSTMGSVRAYDVSFWSGSQSFSRTFSVMPRLGYDSTDLEFEECRRVFRRHGAYRWRVSAELADGRRVVSRPGEFMVAVPVSHEEFVPWMYPYAIQLQHVNRYSTAEYDAFLAGLSSSKPLKDFSSLGLVFRQALEGAPAIELEERLLILSHIGLGLRATVRFRLWRNMYFSLHPVVDTEYHWFSTGLQDYASSLYSVKVGGDWLIMPKGFFTIRACWVPVYRIRYAWADDELRTWQGNGWETGLRLIIPSHAVDNFRLLGMEIDFRRLPLEFHYGQIRDEYSGTLMKLCRFSIGYLLW